MDSEMNDSTTTAAEQVCPDCPHPVKDHAGAGCLDKTPTPEAHVSPSGVKSTQYEYCACRNSKAGIEAFFAERAIKTGNALLEVEQAGA